jgi:hypothetical protein
MIHWIMLLGCLILAALNAHRLLENINNNGLFSLRFLSGLGVLFAGIGAISQIIVLSI